MERLKEIKDYIRKARPDEIDVLLPLAEEVVFLEGELDRLRKLPMLRVNPDNPAMQKATPASRMYKELLQQYNNCIKTIVIKTGGGDEDTVTPLREYFANKKKAEAYETR